MTNHVVPGGSVPGEQQTEQLNLFTDHEALEQERAKENIAPDREKNMQQAVLSTKKKFGKNAILKGINLQLGKTPKTAMNRLADIKRR